MNKKLLSFLALLMAVIAAPQAIKAGHTYYLDISNRPEWSSKTIYCLVSWNNNGYSNYTGVQLDDKLIKFDVNYDNVKYMVFADTSDYNSWSQIDSNSDVSWGEHVIGCFKPNGADGYYTSDNALYKIKAGNENGAIIDTTFQAWVLHNNFDGEGEWEDNVVLYPTDTANVYEGTFTLTASGTMPFGVMGIGADTSYWKGATSNFSASSPGPKTLQKNNGEDLKLEGSPGDKYNVTWNSESHQLTVAPAIVTPTISVDAPNGKYFTSKTATINFTFDGTDSAWYSFDGGSSKTTLTNANKAVTIGNASGNDYQEVTVTYAPTRNATGDDIKTVTYILTTKFVCFVDVDNSGWNAVKAHLWGSGSGEPSLTPVDGTVYKLELNNSASDTGINCCFFESSLDGKTGQTVDINPLILGACYKVGYTNDNSKRPVETITSYIPPVAGPTITLSPANGHTFSAATDNSVTLTATNTEGAWYRIDGGTLTSVNDGSHTITLPDNNTYLPKQVTLTYCVGGTAEPTTATYTIPGKPVSGSEPTYTLPVLHMTFPDNEIIDKDLADKEYRNGTYWLEIPDGVSSWMPGAVQVGTEDSQLGLKMKARGNYTRCSFSKKPYRVKLDAKQNLLGLTEGGSKDYTLLTHADDDKGYLRNLVGFELGRLIGLPWAPNQQPVELVVNGDYRGIYFLTEAIKVDPARVNVDKQKDEETDPMSVTGGWVVELDNYPEAAADQIVLNEMSCATGHNVDKLRVTLNTPEVLSDIQRRFLTDQFVAMNSAVGRSNESDDIWSYIDLDDAVRYYLVMEMVHHTESFHGSTYMQRKKGAGEKWHFSPLWDMGHAFEFQNHNKYFYNDDTYGNTWIPSLRMNAKFNDKLKETWKWFVSQYFDTNTHHLKGSIATTINDYIDHIAVAARADRARWGSAPLPSTNSEGKIPGTNYEPSAVADNSDIYAAKDRAVGDFEAKLTWLLSQSDFGDLTNADEPTRDNTTAAALPTYITDPDNATTTTIYVYNQGNWDNIRIYLYTSTGQFVAWDDRSEMLYDATLQYMQTDKVGLYKFVVPEEFKNANIFITNSDANSRWPAQDVTWNDPPSGDGAYIGGKSWLFVTGDNKMTQVDDGEVHPYVPAEVYLVGDNLTNANGTALSWTPSADGKLSGGTDGIFTYRLVATDDASLCLAAKVATSSTGTINYGPDADDTAVKADGKKNKFDSSSTTDNTNKWVSLPRGLYDVTVDWISGNITFSVVAPDNLYLIGYDNNWNVEGHEPMTKNGAVFTQVITVTGGPREIRLASGVDHNFGPAVTHTAIVADGKTANTFSIDDSVNNENTWAGLTDGTYEVTVDWAKGSMVVRPVIPTVTIDPLPGSYTTRTLEVTINFIDTDKAWYSLDGGTNKTILNSQNNKFYIGNAESTVDQTFTITYAATADATGQAIKTATYTLKYAPFRWYLHNNFEGGEAWSDGELLEVTDSEGHGTGVFKAIVVRTAENAAAFVIKGLAGTTEKWYHSGTEEAKWIGVSNAADGITLDLPGADMVFDGLRNERYEFTWVPETGKLTVEHLKTWYIVGGQFNGKWDADNKDFPMTDRGNGIHMIKVNLLWASGYDTDWFRFHDGTELHGATSGNYTFRDFNVKQDVNQTAINSSNDWSFGWRGTEEPCYVLLDTKNWKMWVDKNPNLPHEIKNRDLTFMPRKVRNANGNWDAWLDTEPVVIIRGMSITSNRLQPDWELTRQSDGSYLIEKVNVRNKELEAVVIYKNDATTYTKKFTIGDAQEWMGTFYNITVTPNGTNEPTVSFELSTPGDKTPPYFGIFGYAFHQLDDDKIDGQLNAKFNTPNYYTALTGVGETQGNTVLGWQESYVLTDHQGNYLTDLNGNLFYNAQWPPRNPIYFSTEVDGKPFELLSTQLTFTQHDYKEIHPESTARYATGQEWVYDLKQGANGALYTNLTLDAGTRYARYVIPSAWLQGAFKIVNGWNTESVGTTANWTGYYRNWGIDGGGTDTNAGADIGMAETKDLEDNSGNMYFGEPTYYNTVEIFVPVNDDGTITSDGYNSIKLYTTANVGQPSISAIATKKNGNDEENNTGRYTIQFRNLNGANVTSITITRYDAIATDINKPRGEWTTAGTDASTNSVSFTIDPSLLQDVTVGVTTIKQYVGVDEVLELNKRYFYVMDYTVDSQEGTFSATSNPFSLLSQTYKPSILPLQLIELTADGLDALHDYIQTVFPDYDDWTATDPHNRIYISRKSGTSGNHYLVWRDNSVDETRHIATIPESMISGWATDETHFTKHNWSSSYLVVGFIGNGYATDMATAAGTGALVGSDSDNGYKTYPEVYAKRGNEITLGDFNEANALKRYVVPSAKDGSNLFIYASFVNNDGNLDEVQFAAGMEYWYRPVGASVVTKRTFDVTSTTPVMPQPWGVKWSYDYEEVETPQATDADYITFTIPSSVNPEKDVDVHVKPEQLANRRLNVIYQFNRPNITNEVRDYYDIQYAIGVYTINERDYEGVPTNTRVITKGVYHDTETDLDGQGDTSKGVYHIKVHGVNPETDIYPALGIYNTTYVPNKWSESSERRRATYGTTTKVNVLKTDEVGRYLDANDNIVERDQAVIHEREFDSWLPAKFELTHSGEDVTVKGLRLGYYQNTAAPAGQQYEWQYQGHTDFTDIDQLTGQGIETLKPNLYFIELSTGFSSEGSYCAYPFIVNHVDGHHSHQGEHSYQFGQNQGYYLCDNDPLVGIMIGKGFKDATVPTFYATPVYIFDRVADEMAISGEGTAEITELKPVMTLDKPSTPNGVKARANSSTSGISYPHYGTTPFGETTDLDSFHYEKANEGAFDNYVLIKGTPVTQDVTADGGVVTGIENVKYDGDDYEVFYDLQGREVPNPSTGVYIRITRRGAEKVYIK